MHRHTQNIYNTPPAIQNAEFSPPRHLFAPIFKSAPTYHVRSHCAQSGVELNCSAPVSGTFPYAYATRVCTIVAPCFEGCENVCVYVYVCMYVCTGIKAQLLRCVLSAVRMSAYVYVRVHVCMHGINALHAPVSHHAYHTYIHTYIHTRIHTYTHTYIHTTAHHHSSSPAPHAPVSQHTRHLATHQPPSPRPSAATTTKPADPSHVPSAPDTASPGAHDTYGPAPLYETRIQTLRATHATPCI